jgi:ribonuclease R
LAEARAHYIGAIMAEFPTKDAILQWIEDNPEATRRDIARAFGIKGAAKIDFKALLKEMEEDGAPVRRRQRHREESAGLPPVTVIEVTGPTPRATSSRGPWTGAARARRR